MISKRAQRIFGAVILLSLFALWLIFLYNFPPTEIVEFMGINNGYILTFIAAILGGTSIFVPFPYHLIIFTLAAGGLNPFFLGFLAGTGVLIGDSTSYLIGYTGREIITGKIAAAVNKIYLWIIKKPKWVLPTFLYVYSSISPTSNDFIIIPLGFARYPYTRVVIPLWLGSITFNTILAFAGLYGWEWVISFF